MHKRIALLSIEHPYERLILQALCGMLLMCIATYLYFVTASVLNVIARKEATMSTARLESAVAGMEKEYFALKGALSPSVGSSLGLAPVENTSYVHRPGTAAVNVTSADTIERDAI